MDARYFIFFLPIVFNYLEEKGDLGVFGEVGAITHVGKRSFEEVGAATHIGKEAKTRFFFN